MEFIFAWFIVLTIPSFSVGILVDPAGETVNDPELYEAMKVENIESVFGPGAFANAPIYDEEGGQIIPGVSMAPSQNPVQFYLYSSSDPEVEHMIDFSEEGRSILEKHFNESAHTKIICHGFMSNYKDGPGSLLRSAYFKAYKHVNVILINWSSLAGVYRALPNKWSNLFYFPPASNTKIVGEQTAALINFLVDNFGVSPFSIHLVGHSLGAHAMGHAGLALQKGSQEKVSRITALDPAGPCFEKKHLVCFWGTYRAITNTDAQFVDVIHTHSQLFGMEKPVGHADFYPNGGSTQDGCSTLTFGICSHRRAIEQMADSILFGRTIPGRTYLEAKQCSDWKTYNDGLCTSAPTSEMGEFCSVGSNGSYYLKMTPLSTMQRALLLAHAGMSAFMPRAEISKLHVTP